MKNRKRASSPEAIKKRNEAFARMSPEQKRVTVAKDVIAALNAKQLVAKNSVYLALRFKQAVVKDWNNWDKFTESDAQVALLEQKVSCEVCAIGSVFVCAVERMDKLTVDQFRGSGRRSIREYLGDLFSLEQLDLMEIAFECTTEHAQTVRYRGDEDEGKGISNGAQSELDAAVGFGEMFWDYGGVDGYNADACMRAIMANIIANKGEFRP